MPQSQDGNDLPNGLKIELDEIDALAMKMGPYLLPLIIFVNEMFAYSTFLQNKESLRLSQSGLGYYEIIDGETIYIIERAKPGLVAHLNFLIERTNYWNTQLFMLTRVYEMYTEKTWQGPDWEGVSWSAPPTPPPFVDYPPNPNN